MENNGEGPVIKRRFLIVRRTVFVLLAIILFLYGLNAARNFLFPIALAYLLAYLLYPVVNFLEKHKFPRILANFIAIIAVLGVLASLVLLGYSQLKPMFGDLPDLAKKGVENLSGLLGRLSTYLGMDSQNTSETISQRVSAGLSSGGEYLQEVFKATTNTIVSILLLPVYIFLFLFYRTKFAYFLMELAGRRRRQEMINILREISKVSARYMAGILVVVLILCFLNSLGLWIVGVKFPIALGIISAIFNLIPYFGTLLGGAVPFLFALVIESDPALAFRVVLLFVVIQFTENNILTPNIVGGQVKINPFFVITGLVGASMIWGIPGMLLVVPFLAMMRIIFSHLDPFAPYAFLLGETGTEKHSISFKGIKKKFKRKMK